MGGPSKRTKIVATIGPASESEEMLRRLIDAGMDVARLNFSHRAAEVAKPLVERIRKVADETGVFVAILGDLRGPRIRVGEMENGSIDLQRGQKIVLTSDKVIGNPGRIGVSFKGLHRDVAPGAVLLLDDGNIELQVLEIRASGDILCDIVRGAQLKSNKGVNLKNRRVSLPSLTTKDYQDLDFAVSEFALNDPRIAVSSNEKEVTDTLLQLLDRLSSAPELAGLRANRSRLLCCTYLHHLRMQDSGGDYLQL